MPTIIYNGTFPSSVSPTQTLKILFIKVSPNYVDIVEDMSRRFLFFKKCFSLPLFIWIITKRLIPFAICTFMKKSWRGEKKSLCRWHRWRKCSSISYGWNCKMKFYLSIGQFLGLSLNKIWSIIYNSLWKCWLMCHMHFNHWSLEDWTHSIS